MKYKVSGRNVFLPQSIFGILPAATNVVALRPHQTKGAKRTLFTKEALWKTSAPQTKNAESAYEVTP
ncbi:hypothetical protein [Shewanella aestuarii]|uniref:Uncharacterized protein n=1 Tax=Shewanella aestuarii TaxID=1028752 RepID=A0A6G9QLB5_9GAMM|nr:hypothetical protein [Shewanella aestuarii]QIR15370.1 hypothetical protein HBH39_13435 [Shewanella aestuarii]